MKILLALVLFTTMIQDISINEPQIIYDYYQGIEESKHQQKPILLVFTGMSCENNMHLNEVIKKDPYLLQEITNNYIPVLLYVDDRTKLPKEKKVNRDGKEITIRTKGSEWANISISKYNSYSQPFIVIIDENEKILKAPIKGAITKTELLDYIQF